MNQSNLATAAAPLFSQHAPPGSNQLQIELVSTARKWAVNELGTAIAHQLHEPLTALLLYLHEIKAKGDKVLDTDDPMLEIVEKALSETENVCMIMDRIGCTVEGPIDGQAAVARGREAIDVLTRNSRARSFGLSLGANSAQHRLTPREREVLSLIVGGTSNKEGGHLLGISTRTFEVHRSHIMEKLGAKNAADLVRMVLSDMP